MRRIKSLFFLLLCAVLVMTSIPKKASAFDDSLPVGKVRNQKVFSILRNGVPSSTTTKNYNNNKKATFSSDYVLNQNWINMKVGGSTFAGVGCELAACYNASVVLSKENNKTINKNWLANYIKIAEEKGYTMTLTSGKLSRLADELIVPYTDSKKEKYFYYFLKIMLPRSYVIEILKLANVNLTYLAGFGTDPFAIPEILKKGGVAKVGSTFTTYSTFNRSIATARNNKATVVYIISYWNESSLIDCLKGRTGFHTICVYTKGGKLYSLNEKANSNCIDTPPSVPGIMDNDTSRFIVGYSINLQ